MLTAVKGTIKGNTVLLEDDIAAFDGRSVVVTILDAPVKKNDILHEALIDFIVDLEFECGKVLSVLVISQNDYTKWNSIVPFYKNVKQEGVVLWTAA